MKLFLHSHAKSHAKLDIKTLMYYVALNVAVSTEAASAPLQFDLHSIHLEPRLNFVVKLNIV